MPRILPARSKPVHVDAVRFTDPTQVADTLRWLNDRGGVGYGFYDHRTSVWIDTPHGRKIARLGDWVVALPRKQFEVLTNVEFEQRYDLIGYDE